MITANTPPTYPDILKAHEVIKPFASRTPVLTSQQVNDRAQAQVFFKCEHFQKVGAFKFRGGCHAVMSLSRKMPSVVLLLVYLTSFTCNMSRI